MEILRKPRKPKGSRRGVPYKEELLEIPLGIEGGKITSTWTTDSYATIRLLRHGRRRRRRRTTTWRRSSRRSRRWRLRTTWRLLRFRTPLLPLLLPPPVHRRPVRLPLRLRRDPMALLAPQGHKDQPDPLALPVPQAPIFTSGCL